jgi:hypothetical protein
MKRARGAMDRVTTQVDLAQKATHGCHNLSRIEEMKRGPHSL